MSSRYRVPRTDYEQESRRREAERREDYPLIPDPFLTENGDIRFHHRDLNEPDYDRELAWAETVLIRARIAEMVWYHESGRAVGRDADGQLVYELAWLRDRLARLDAILRRRAA